VGWRLGEAWVGGGRWPPRFGRENAALFALALALGVFSVLRSGAGPAMAPLVERTAVLALALCSYRWVRRRRGSLEPARAATALALFAVTAIGVAQALGHDPLAALSAGDGRGSTFGNANMAAQYVALALLLLLSSPRPLPRWRRWSEAAVMAVAAGWLLRLGTRSAILALGAGLLALTLTSRRTAAVRKGLALAGCVVVVALAWFTAARLFDDDLRARKTTSIEYRLRVWFDTLCLVAEHPLGVGAGNFEDAHRRYQAEGEGVLDERQVFRHPHNEYLRVAADEGLPLLVLLGVLLVRLGRRVARARREAEPPGLALVAAWAAFLAVEAFFQFPLALAFPALVTALLLGLALWQAELPGPMEADVPAGPSAAWRIGAGVTAGLLLLGVSRVALSEWLFVNAPHDVAAQERACRLDARNLPACVMAAYLHGAAGDVPGARKRAVRVLERAPHYPPAIKLLAQLALIAGDREAGCTYLTAYEVLFRGQSTLHEELQTRCDARERGRAALRVPSSLYEVFPLAGGDAR
jgi:O-antigen ligase